MYTHLDVDRASILLKNPDPEMVRAQRLISQAQQPLSRDLSPTGP